ncbi:MAG: DNA recombination protein RmuC [Alphaproteobacteria bacterium]|nr:DNA recombination protein RmuC [Alphaproteobacteria bacterium]
MADTDFTAFWSGLDMSSLALGTAAGVILTLLVAGWAIVRLERDRAGLKARLEAQQLGRDELDGLFARTAQEALQRSNEQFLQLAQEKLKQAQNDGSYDLEKRQKAISDLVKPVDEHLRTLSAAVEQLKGTDKAIRDDLQSLHRETAKLSGALRSPTAQGQWGEYILERLLDNSGLMKGVHYNTQVSLETPDGRMRPDVIIRLQDGFNIVVDAKAPVNQFADRLQEDMPEADYKKLMSDLAGQVRVHVKALGAKNYWEQLNSPDFVVLFLPSEHLFSAALRADPTLVDYASENRIVIASPTLMMALLRVVGLSWRQVELARNAQDISAIGADLYQRLSTFSGHLEKAGRGLGQALEGYNKAMGSLERMVLPAARKLKDLHVQTGGKILEDPTYIEALPRSFTGAPLTLAPGDADDYQEEKRIHG